MKACQCQCVCDALSTPRTEGKDALHISVSVLSRDPGRRTFTPRPKVKVIVRYGLHCPRFEENVPQHDATPHTATKPVVRVCQETRKSH